MLTIMLYIGKLILTVVTTLYVFNALGKVDFSKMFKPNSGGEIKFLVVILSFILGYTFSSIIIGLFSELFTLLA